MADGLRLGSRTQASDTSDGRSELIEAVPVRNWGQWIGAVVAILLVVWLSVVVLSSEAADWELVPEYLLNANILTGLGNTLLISVTAMLLGIVLGVVFAVMRLSGNSLLTALSGLYIWLFRGTPVLVQLLLWYNLSLIFRNIVIGIPFTDIVFFEMPMNDFMTPFMAALLGLGLNEGAYMAEIVRGGIQSIDKGQTEAAQALGMTSSQTTRRVVLPQAMRVIIPPTGNEFITMLKLSALATVVVYPEMLRQAQNIYTSNLKIIELLVTVSIWYLLVTSVATTGQYFLERRYARGVDGAPAPLVVRLAQYVGQRFGRGRGNVG